MKWFANNWQLVAAALVGTLGLWAATSARAQVLPETAKRGKVTILKTVTLNQGDTCIGATKKARHPLSEKQCDALLESVGRVGYTDHRNPMMQIKIRPQFQVGDQLFYVKSGGKRGWVMSSHLRTRNQVTT